MILHQFQHLRLAQAFSDYLTLLEIDNSIEYQKPHYQIILKYEQRLQKAQAELQLFLSDPNQEKYLSASWSSGNTQTNLTDNSYQSSNLLRQFMQHGGLLTHSVFIFCIIIYAMATLGLLQPIQSDLAFLPATPSIFHKAGVLLPLLFYILVPCILCLIYCGGGN
ncbi:hypothetical protein ACLKMH_00375 [Psychromonas sp. KJ10-10]|uniref:hypothetical protein n=1 Tax=Psychromonas sp. KJ10-10 TaxID=3391823 RepID=UPI0039B60900